MREMAGSYQRRSLVEQVDDPRRPSYHALVAIPVMRSIVARGSQLDQSRSGSLFGIDLPQGAFRPDLINAQQLSSSG
jgi:hypothetical protein